MVVDPVPAETKVEPEDIAIDIIFEDDDIVVVNKAPGMVVHPSVGHETGTLVNALLHHVSALAISDERRPGIVHRLDKDTSGVMVVAKTDHAMAALTEQFRSRSVRKTYGGFCFGAFKKSPVHLVTSHGRHPKNRLRYTAKMAYDEEEHGHLRRAEAHYRSARYREGVTAMSARLVTGRTHQIRAQLADRGNPMVGDVLYGGGPIAGRIVEGPIARAARKMTRQALHAFTLELSHPRTEQPMSFSAPLPEDFTPLASLLDVSESMFLWKATP